MPGWISPSLMEDQLGRILTRQGQPRNAAHVDESLQQRLPTHFFLRYSEQNPCSYGVCRVGDCLSPLLRRRSNCCCKTSNSWSDKVSKSIRLLRAPCTPWMS